MNHSTGSIGVSRQAQGWIMLLCLAGVVWILSGWILASSSQMLVLGGMGLATVAILVITLQDWRRGLYLFIGWLLFEDLLRKFMGNGTIFFFGKDILATITIFSLLLEKQRRRVLWFRPRFLTPLALFVGLAVIQVFNPASPSVLYGLLGLKLYFFYVPLMYAGYALLRTNRDLERFLVYSLALGLVIAGLGIVQSIVGLSFLNPAHLAPALQDLGDLMRESPLTHQILASPTSVFVSSGRFDVYVILVAILALGAQAYLLLTHRRRAMWGFLGVGVAIVAAMQSGSRGSILWVGLSALVITVAVIWGAPWYGAQRQRVMKAFRLAALAGVVGLAMMVFLFPSKIEAPWAFYTETLSPSSSASQLGYRTVDYPFANLLEALGDSRWPIGDGTGTASLGTQYVAMMLGQPQPTAWVENGWGILIMEMGILGPILWLIWTGTLLILGWRIVRELRNTTYFPIAFAFFWYLFVLLGPMSYFGMASYQNYVMNAYCWILVGMLWRLPSLAKEQRQIPAMAARPEVARSPVPVEVH